MDERAFQEHIGGQVLESDEKLDETLRKWPGNEIIPQIVSVEYRVVSQVG